MIHFGRASYVKTIVKQAESVGNIVYLIGDKTNRGCADQHFDAAHYLQSAERFRSSYRHLSLNPENSELACFIRWFVLRDFMKTRKLPVVFACDSDVMVYSDVSELWKCIGPLASPVYVRTGQTGPWRVAQAGEGFWTLPAIEQFCQLLEKYYSTSEGLAKLEGAFADLVQAGSQGGVSDMMLLWEFAKETGVPEGPTICDGKTFCHNINDSEGIFEMVDAWPAPIAAILKTTTALIKSRRWQSLDYVISYCTQPHAIKAISWKAGKPYGQLKGSGERIRFHSLHFAGRAKRIIRKFECARTASENNPTAWR